MPVIDVHAGTPESAWRASPRLAQLDELRLDLAGKIVVVSPHPDDETLGLGGTLHQLARAKRASIRIVALTDGEASHPHSPTHTRRALAAWRVREQVAALACLGLLESALIRLRLPDGALPNTGELDRLLAPLIADAACCFAPYPYDGHPDHDAAGAAASRVAQSHGVPLWTYPIWAWHWSCPESEALPWHKARRVQLDAAAQSGKRAALRAYRSQIAPLSNAPGDASVLSADTLAHFDRNYEVLFS
jgi:LmbE family N-acetylglucosaminyl deacetylase